MYMYHAVMPDVYNLLSQGLHIQYVHAHTFCGGSEDIFEQKDVLYVLQRMHDSV